MNSILITGGTGSFGRAFTRFLLGHTNIERICIFSRGEHTQADMRQDFRDDPRLRWFIGDVRDKSRLLRAAHGVDTIVHAAALKRIEVGQYNPDEMVLTNVVGTMNVIDTAAAVGAKRMVTLSTDKACFPVSPYGQSKALAESLTLAANHLYGANGPKFAATRYGNVWNAQGSVVPRWKTVLSHAEAHGLPARVPVTDLDCTRFFMTKQEAVEMVWHLLLEMQGGELKIPTLPAYRLGDLVEAFNAEAVVVGLPAWEKKHEMMTPNLTSDEARRMSIDELRAALAYE